MQLFYHMFFTGCQSIQGYLVKVQFKPMPLTFTDHFQGRQKVIITNYSNSQQHVENDHEVNDQPPILPLLHGEEAIRKLGGLG